MCDPDTIDAIYAELSTTQQKVKELEAPVFNDISVDWGNAQAWAIGATHSPPPAYPGGVTIKYAPASKPRPPMTSPIMIAARHDGKCLTCGKRFTAGTDIRWMAGAGAWCLTTQCYHIWEAKQKGIKFAP